jgi:hypothetical protein
MALSRLIRHSRRYLPLIAFYLFISLLAWLSLRYSTAWDWTASQRHSLSATTEGLLKQMPDVVAVDIYARDNAALRARLRELLQPYQRIKPNLQLTFIDPEIEVDRAREESITVDGELIIHYRGRSEHVTQRDELGISTALQRLARTHETWIAFTVGHAERSIQKDANYDISDFAKELRRRGMRLQPLNLLDGKIIPDNVAALVIASPQTYFLPGETQLIRQFIDRGGSLFWLIEPGDDLKGLEPLAERLGLETLPGALVDPKVTLLGIQDPAVVYVNEYADHPALRGVNAPSVFPRATALEWQTTAPWTSHILLESNENSWNEAHLGQTPYTLNPENDERSGPHTFGLALTRAMTHEAAANTHEQRAVILGDGDFLSNQYLGNGANLLLGSALIEWLAHEDRFVELGKPSAPDSQINFSTWQIGLIAAGFMLVLPLALALSGVFIMRRRRRH